VGQIWVYGNSFKSFLIAVVVPSGEFVRAKATELKCWEGEDSRPSEAKFRDAFEKLFTGNKGAEFKKIIFDEMNKQNSNLKGFEKVKDIIIESSIDEALAGFTEKNECLTPSFKLKRPFLLKRYLKQLKEVYAANGEPQKDGEKWPGE